MAAWQIKLSLAFGFLPMISLFSIALGSIERDIQQVFLLSQLRCTIIQQLKFLTKVKILRN